nr:hypothetical protein CFP56_09459 [Quercus suber]
MDNFSVELLAHIAEWLDHRNLLRFSSVSRGSRYSCLARILRTLKLPFSSPESLIAVVDEADTFLRTATYLQYVKHLEVAAAKPVSLAKHIRVQHGWGSDERSSDPWKYSLADSKRLTNENEWQMLTMFVKSLPALDELTWACQEQIPMCILRHLHTIVPRCRLHLRRFELQNLIS